MNKIDEQVSFDCFLGIIYEVHPTTSHNVSHATTHYMFEQSLTTQLKSITQEQLHNHE